MQTLSMHAIGSNGNAFRATIPGPKMEAAESEVSERLGYNGWPMIEIVARQRPLPHDQCPVVCPAGNGGLRSFRSRASIVPRWCRLSVCLSERFSVETEDRYYASALLVTTTFEALLVVAHQLPRSLSAAAYFVVCQGCFMCGLYFLPRRRPS